MNKYIKQLVESFFDDMFDEQDVLDNDSILSDIDDIKDTADDLTIKTVYKAGNFTECRTIDDIIDTYIDRDEFIKWYNDNISEIIRIFKDADLDELVNMGYITQLFKDLLRYKISYNRYKCCFEYIPPTPTPLYINFALHKTNDINVLLIGFSTCPYATQDTNIIKNNRGIMFIPICGVKDGNIVKTDTVFGKEFDINTYRNVVSQVVSVNNLAEKILTENNYTGKVYTITQKDIDRMVKCKQTNKYTGFTAITTLSKLIPRMCAGLKQFMSKLEYDDKTLLKWCQGEMFIYKYINIDMRDKLRLKDLVETFNDN